MVLLRLESLHPRHAKTGRVQSRLSPRRRGSYRAILLVEDPRSTGGFIRCETSFNQDFCTFPNVLVTDFSLLASCGDAKPNGLFYLFACACGVLAMGRYRKCCVGLTRWCCQSTCASTDIFFRASDRKRDGASH